MRFSRWIPLTVVAFGLAVLPSCGDDDGAPPADAMGGGTVDAPSGGFDATPAADAPPEGAAVGEACAEDADCLGDTCLLPAIGFPDGYCSVVGCDPDDASACDAFGGDGVCLPIDDATSLCLDRCAGPADCRTGYECLTVTVGLSVCAPVPVCGNGIVERDEECEPPDTGNCGTDCQGTGTAAIGEACAGPEDCLGDICIDATQGWPMGYCSSLDCDLAMADSSCDAFGGDGVCIDVGDAGAPVGLCLDACQPFAPVSQCRTGYFCSPGGPAGGVCFPTPVCGDGMVDFPEECDPPSAGSCSATCVGSGTAQVGAACTTAADCAGNVCLTDEVPGGYCSQVGCDTANADTSCVAFGGDAYCLDVADPGQPPIGLCFDGCLPDAGDCRAGYVCGPAGVDVHLCFPGPVCGDGIVDFPEECDPPSVGGCSATCLGPGTAPVGAACTNAGECAGDLCLGVADGFPAGYCSDFDCDLTADPVAACAGAGGDGYCLDATGEGFGLCLDQCGGPNGACRTNYTCTDFGGGLRLCTPT